tara:strand:- start:154 stop:336 length:183 start_codon:yes stop_codon:yes gene_type:complete
LNAQDGARLDPPKMQQKQDLGVVMRWMQAESEGHIAVVADPIAMKPVGVDGVPPCSPRRA